MTTLTLLLIAEIVGSILVVVSVWLAGKKSTWSPILTGGASVAFVVFGVLNGAWFFVGLQVALAAIAVRNFFLWRSQKTQPG